MVVSGAASCVTWFVVTLTTGSLYPNDTLPLAREWDEAFISLERLCSWVSLLFQSHPPPLLERFYPLPYVVTQHLSERMGQQAC